MSKLLAVLVYQEVFFNRHYYTYSCNWTTWKYPCRGMKTYHLIFAKVCYLIACYYDTNICLKQLRCIIMKVPNNRRQLIVLFPGFTQLKRS